MLCFACPNCHEVMSAPEDAVGETVACPVCYQYLQVPKMSAPVEPPKKKKEKAAVKPPPMPKAAPPRPQVQAPPPPPRPQVQAPPPPRPLVQAPPPRPQVQAPPPPRPTAPVPPPKAAPVPAAPPTVPIVSAPTLPAVSASRTAPVVTVPALPQRPLVDLLIQRARRLPKWTWLAAAVASVFFLCLGGVSLMRGDKGKPVKNVRAKVKVVDDDDPNDPLLDITAKTLFKAYQDNVYKADDLYKGKELTLMGEVDNVARTDEGDPVIHLIGGKYELTKVRCILDPKFRNNVLNINRGARIRIHGTCAGKMQHVILTDCEILD